MAKCVYCGRDTQLYSNGVPVCLACEEDPDARRKPPARQEDEPADEDKQTRGHDR